MTLYENDLVRVVEELRLKGYSEDFVIKDNLIFSKGLNRGFGEEEVTIEGAYQFEIVEQTLSTQNLFAIFIPQFAARGLLIDLLGMYFYIEDQSISSILQNAPLITYTFDDEDPYMKYGLRKITPAEFNDHSDRYVLRIGYPDFPECPAGEAFSMLGFDEQRQEYTWLPTSVLKDSRLKKVEYKGKNGSV